MYTGLQLKFQGTFEYTNWGRIRILYRKIVFIYTTNNVILTLKALSTVMTSAALTFKVFLFQLSCMFSFSYLN